MNFPVTARVTLWCMLGVSMFLSSCAKTRIIGRGERIHHDDFEYSVAGLMKQREIGSTVAHGTFYIVTFKVENLAMRVGHRWDTTIGYVVDRDGRSYENNDAARRLLLEGDGGVARRSFDTPAGCTDSTVLVFDIPDDAHEPCLQVRGELLMGDLFDGDQFEKTKVRLF